MTEPIFDTVAIVGLGLIGSSVARGLKARGLARRVVGYDSSTQVDARAKELGFCDRVANTPAEAVKDAELVLIAVPVGATADAVKSVAPHLREGAILTEVGSVKAAVIRQVLAVLAARCGLRSGPPDRRHRAFRPRRRLRRIVRRPLVHPHPMRAEPTRRR